MTPIETLLYQWADWTKQGDTPRFDPTPDPKTGRALGYSLGDSTLADKAGMAGVPNHDPSGVRSAKGVHTRTVKPREVGEVPPLIAAVEEGMAYFHVASPLLWAVGMGFYLGDVPVGFSLRKRRARFTRDETTGMLKRNRTRVARSPDATDTQWMRLVGRHMNVSERMLRSRLSEFHEAMAAWVYARTLKKSG